MDFQSLVVNIPFGVFRIVGETSGKFLLANSECSKMLGYGSGKQLSGIEMKDLFLEPSEGGELLNKLIVN